MKYRGITFIVSIFLAATLGCKGPELMTRATKGATIKSRCELVGDNFLVTIYVPNAGGVNRVNAWNVLFQEGNPEGLNVIASPELTTVSWLVPKGRISRSPALPYLIQFSNPSFQFDAKVALRPSGSALLDATNLICSITFLGNIIH